MPAAKLPLVMLVAPLMVTPRLFALMVPAVDVFIRAPLASRALLTRRTVPEPVWLMLLNAWPMVCPIESKP